MDSEKKLLRKIKGKTGWEYVNVLGQRFEKRWGFDTQSYTAEYTNAQAAFIKKRYERIYKVCEVDVSGMKFSL